MNSEQSYLSWLVILVTVLTCLLVDLDFKNWRESERIIEHDIHHYYGYLPAQFILDDIKIEKSDYQYEEGKYWFWQVPTNGGKRVFKMTCGLAVLYSPFFFIGHQVAIWFDYPATGFSEPYKFFLLLSSLFYLFVGLFFVRKLLKKFDFSENVIAITLAIIGLGTNLFCYSSQAAPMSHVYSFSLIAAFVYFVIRYYETNKISYLIFLSLSMGLISLVRPSNAIVFIIFLFYDCKTFKDFGAKSISMLNLFIIFFFILLVWIPQFAYWKISTGNFLVFTYGNEEKFYFLDPKIIDGLFSFRKGWLVYTPLIVFALAGIFWLKDKLAQIKLGLIIFLIINIYVVFSWWCWWYGGSYGQRALIDSYALLAIPLAAFVNYIAAKKWYIKLPFSILVLFFIWLNIFQTYQYEFKSLHYEAMSKKLYFKQFGKLNKIDKFDEYLIWPNTKKALNRE